jgi:membrane associated rhomboid family serine protease
VLGRTIAGATAPDRPLVVFGLIALNTAIYLLTAVQAGSPQDNQLAPLFTDWSLYPPAVAAGQWWRLFTSGFLHFGPIHLLFNMLALWVIGRDFELVLGRTRFLAVYLSGLLGGSAAALVFGSLAAQTAGASGAVFGLMGGLAVVLRRLRQPPGPALTMIGINLVLSVVVPNISIWGHLGGLAVGAVVTAAMVYAPARNRVAWQVGATAGVVLLLLVVMAVRTATLGGY